MDLKTIRFMIPMLDAGVRVFGIGGRVRGPESVRTGVQCFSEAVRSYVEGAFGDSHIAFWDERLKTVLARHCGCMFGTRWAMDPNYCPR
jgi:Collagenase and related proteases